MIRIVFVLLLCWLLPSPALAEKRVALVVGIDKYDHLGRNAQLARARSDARAVAGLLKDLGFEVIAKDERPVTRRPSTSPGMAWSSAAGPTSSRVTCRA
jgi:hypothetical protein